MKKGYVLIILFLVAMAFLYKESFTGYFAKSNAEEGKIDAYFCPESNCSAIIASEIMQGRKYVHCAFYDANLYDVVDSLKAKSGLMDTRLVTDNDNPSNLRFAITDNRNGLMHDKFCVIDGMSVITGSFNPTVGGLDDENNLLLIKSKTIASNYEDEFSEFQNGIFGKGNRVKSPVANINGTRVENYFCPEDWCSDKVLKAVAHANKSIHFMIFSFTDDSIGDLFIQKFKEGIDVSGVLDIMQNKKSNYSEYPKLLSAGINVSLFGDGKRLLHNKVIIIDGRIVITGSYNPTSNGDKVNDENIVIIYDERIAGQYEEKFMELMLK
jgi:phosphatidylserine/phosphatidylglycerophosphate/cardiolipin synthase-like enzyme